MKGLLINMFFYNQNSRLCFELLGSLLSLLGALEVRRCWALLLHFWGSRGATAGNPKGIQLGSKRRNGFSLAECGKRSVDTWGLKAIWPPWRALCQASCREWSRHGSHREPGDTRGTWRSGDMEIPVPWDTNSQAFQHEIVAPVGHFQGSLDPKTKSSPKGESEKS